MTTAQRTTAAARTQQGWLWASVAVIVALVVVLGVLVQRLADLGPAPSLLQRIVVDGTFGLYLGWVAVATCANITATLVADGVETPTVVGELVAALVVAVVVAVAAVVVARTGPRWSVAVSAAWGLAWIAVGRLTDEPSSTLVGVVAALAAVAVLGLTARAAARG